MTGKLLLTRQQRHIGLASFFSMILIQSNGIISIFLIEYERLSTRPSLLHCPLCDQIISGYQELMNHVQSHPHQPNEITDEEYSRRLSVPLPRPSESVQHVRIIRNRSVKSQSPSPPSPFRTRRVRGNDSDKIVHVNQHPLHRHHRHHPHIMSTRLEQLPPPSPSLSYRVSLVRGNDDGRGVHTNQHLSPPPYCYGRGMNGNQRQQMLQSTIAIDLNEIAYEFERPCIKEIDFPILDRSDPSQLKFKPQFICDNETSRVDLSLRL
ncbi:hypothetical protein RND71_035049 [Anisodus tanguticus]|uniref:C2H2-type domain-containing protein n=1 Tax=Anisodus tanguticus TaxID=243964 RepID=A0AAE1UU51_9SOLA|nr:hypothetical protein RND71_035049 [Anisodus tanguticus]